MTIRRKSYGTHTHLVVRNDKGLITACLYILPDGTIHGDSWIKPSGWK